MGSLRAFGEAQWHGAVGRCDAECRLIPVSRRAQLGFPFGLQ